MWKELKESPPFFLFFIKKCKYNILITDFIKIWEVCYTEEDFLKCLKDSNFHLEINTYELLEKGTQILNTPKDIKSLEITQDKTNLTVIATKLFGYPLYLKITLKEGSPELFFQKVTQPLLKTVKDLRCGENELRKVLIKKDEEIEEYKTLGGKIRYTALPPYSDEIHMQMHSEYENNFGTMEISEKVINRKVDIPREVIIEAEIDKKVIKQEPMSQGTSTSNEQITISMSQIKTEPIKTEYKPLLPPRPKKKRMLNL